MKVTVSCASDIFRYTASTGALIQIYCSYEKSIIKLGDWSECKYLFKLLPVAQYRFSATTTLGSLSCKVLKRFMVLKRSQAVMTVAYRPWSLGLEIQGQNPTICHTISRSLLTDQTTPLNSQDDLEAFKASCPHVSGREV